MNRWTPLWMLACIALSAGVNETMRPPSAYVMSPVDALMATGSLFAHEGMRNYNYKLVTMRVVAADRPRLLADTIVIRELWLRSPDQKGMPLDLEAFFDFTMEKHPIATDARDAGELIHRWIPMARHAKDSPQTSQIRLPGTTATSRIVNAQIRIREAIQLDPGNWRISAQLELEVEDGDNLPRLVKGDINARLVWD